MPVNSNLSANGIHTSYIDATPEDWNLRKRGRYSAGDIKELEKHLEAVYEINQDWGGGNDVEPPLPQFSPHP